MIYNLINLNKKRILPKASEVLTCYLKQENGPFWTAFFVKYKDVINDHFEKTCFIHKLDNQTEYLIIRTGCFPFIKYHCSQVTSQDYDPIQIEYQNKFYNLIKLMNFGIPTLAYGIGGLLLYNHSEVVKTSKGSVKIYFWYKENRNSPH